MGRVVWDPGIKELRYGFMVHHLCAYSRPPNPLPCCDFHSQAPPIAVVNTISLTGTNSDSKAIYYFGEDHPLSDAASMSLCGVHWSGLVLLWISGDNTALQTQ